MCLLNFLFLKDFKKTDDINFTRLLGLERSHMDIFTELGVLYARYRYEIIRAGTFPLGSMYNGDFVFGNCICRQDSFLF